MTILLLLSSLALGLLLWSRRGSALDRAARELREARTQPGKRLRLASPDRPVEELLARLRVSLRRVRYDSEKVDEAASIYQNGGLKIDYAAGCTYQNGKEIHLTPIEYKLLCLLAQNTGKVLTHNYILNKIWSSALPSDTPSLRVFMATLRKKIEPDPSHPRYIQTHIGVGYRMIRQPDEEAGAESEA